MKFQFYSSLKRPQNRGAALVLVLAFVLLLSGLVVAYLSRSSTDRRLAKSSFEDNRADLLARSALDIVMGDFKQEIVDGSTSASPPYTPTSNANVVPMRSGNPDTVPNLVRVASARMASSARPFPVTRRRLTLQQMSPSMAARSA
jgi:Tfp pilus assembly protein PilX